MKNVKSKKNENASYEAAIECIAKGRVDQALEVLRSVYFGRGLMAEKALLAMLYVFQMRGSEGDAVILLEDACDNYPDNPKWPEALASIKIKQGEVDAAIIYASRTLKLDPNNQGMFINRTCWIAARCDQPTQVRSMFEEWGRRFVDPITDKATPFSSCNLDLHRKLKIGYISGDFKNHSVRYFIEPFLRLHDRRQYEVYAFMTMQEDEVSQFIKPLVDNWRNVEELDDVSLLNFLRDEKIDILIDLSGHTQGERLSVLAMRAAPVQVTWFGFMQTLGMKAIDWRLTDWGTCPPGMEASYTEKLYRLECMVAYDPPLNSETLYPSPYRKNGYVTMISLNHTRKLTDNVLSVWRDILLDNPRSGLIIIGGYRDSRLSEGSLIPRLKRVGMPMDRVSVSPRLSMEEFMALASVADFALDSFPVSGGTTTLHALWMGLPVLAISDPNHGGLSSSSALTLKGLNLHDCVASTVFEYHEKASKWISDPSRIDGVRSNCRSALQGSPLMNHEARVLEVEKAYRYMWHKYVHNELANKRIEW
jgi:protein O-GlcNAc transferase